MSALTAPDVSALTQQLAEAEATIKALLSGQIDAVVDFRTRSPVLLVKAQEALRVSEERYRRIVETTNEGVWILDPEGMTTFMNRRMAQMLGCEADMGLGRSPLDFLDQDQADAFDRHFQGPGAKQSEICFTRTDGTKIWTLLERSVYDGSGQSEGSLAMVVDITARKQAEVALRASEASLLERMRLAALTADVGMVLTHEDTLAAALEQCAEAMVQHLDVSCARIWTLDPTRDVLELQASTGLAGCPDDPQERVALGHHRVGRIAAQRLPSRTDDVLADAHPGDLVLDGHAAFAGHPLLVNDELVGVLAVFARGPISDAVYTGLGTIGDALAVGIKRKFVTRTNAALESQLRQAQKMEAVGRLAGGIAHDFNNILSVILTCGHFLLEDLNPMDPARADAVEIYKAGQRAAGLTRQLLMFSRQQVLAPRVIDLAVVTANLENMLRRMVGEDVVLVLRNPEQVGWVSADPGSIEQVIMNLVVNARDAMPTGGTLTIETRTEMVELACLHGHEAVHKHVRHVVLSVSDTGVGMDAATQARIFEPFFTTKGVGKGTGLGLSTVFGIVQQSGGSIRVRSEPGKGTTFDVYLPHVDAAADADVSFPKVARRGTESVLLVEDEEQVRAVARAILQRHGYRVIEMRTPLAALAYCKTQADPVHLLLTDVVMPEMSGPELARRLVGVRPDMRVLYMSGYTDASIVHHGVLNAGLDFLQKPFTPDSLTRKVRDLLDSKAKP